MYSIQFSVVFVKIFIYFYNVMYKNISNYITVFYFLLTAPISAITKRALIENFNNKK